MSSYHSELSHRAGNLHRLQKLSDRLYMESMEKHMRKVFSEQDYDEIRWGVDQSLRQATEHLERLVKHPEMLTGEVD